LKVHFKLYGVFRSAVGSATVNLDLSHGEPTVRLAISELVSRPDSSELKKLILEWDTQDPRPNALILVAGREITALNGLDTRLEDGDELSLLPIAHGG
jgi:sulfur-carrier protein